MQSETPIQKAIGSLHAVEREFQGFVSEAVRAGKYIEVLSLTQAAQEIGMLAERLGRPNSPSAASPPGGEPSERPRRPPVAGYPRFHRHGADMFKVGWSKKGREEYTHKAPKGALDAVVAAIEHIGAGGKTFTGETLIAEAGKAGVPAYQTYVFLAWLRQEGLVQRHGREGYSTVRSGGVKADVESRWSALPWERP